MSEERKNKRRRCRGCLRSLRFKFSGFLFYHPKIFFLCVYFVFTFIHSLFSFPYFFLCVLCVINFPVSYSITPKLFFLCVLDISYRFLAGSSPRGTPGESSVSLFS